jgi:hypothetical protein
MKVEFRFQNGTSILILLPDTEREKNCIRMFREGGDSMKLSASSVGTPESLVISTEMDTKKEGKQTREATAGD